MKVTVALFIECDYFRPESMGVICGAVYLIIMFLFIPVPFYKHLAENKTGKFPYHEVRLCKV